MRFRSDRRRRRLESTIDITSLVDVVFLLLIFLLVTTTFKRQEHAFPIELPTSSVEQVTVTTDKTTIFVDREGSLRLLVVPADAAPGAALPDVSEPIGHAELKVKLASMYARHPDISIGIRAEKETSYQKMIDIVGIIEEVGFRHIWFPYDLEQTP